MIANMRHIFICGILLFIVMDQCKGAVYTQPSRKHPDHPDKCLDILTNRAMIPDKEYKLKGICASMTCDSETFSITVVTCPDIEMPDCVELPVDPTRVYPKCCPQFLCRDANGKEMTIDLTS